MGEDVLVKIGADLGQLDQGLTKGQENLRRWGSETRGSMGAANEAMRDLGRSSDSLFGKMREFRQEQVQQGRMARFYAGELASIIPVAGDAKNQLQGLLGLGIEFAAGGLGFAVVVEGVKLAVEWFRDLNKEEREFTAALKQLEAEKPFEGLKPDKAFDALQKATEKSRGKLAGLTKDLEKTQEQLASMDRYAEPERFADLSTKAEVLSDKIAGLGKAVGDLNEKYREHKTVTAGGDPEAERLAGMAAAGERANKILVDQARERADAEKAAAREAQKAWEDGLREAAALGKIIGNTRKADAATDQAFRERANKLLLRENEDAARDEARIEAEALKERARIYEDAMSRQRAPLESAAKMAARAYEESLPPAVQLLHAQDALNDAVGAGLIGYDEWGAGMAKLQADWAAAGGEMTKQTKDVASAMEQGFADHLFEGFDKGLAGMAEGFARTLEQMVAKALAANLMQSIFGLGPNGGWGTDLLNGITGSFPGGSKPASGTGGAFAGGGFARAGTPYLIGERGPELFMPNVSGAVVSNDQVARAMGGGGATSVTLQVHPDALHMTLRDWLEGELARQASVR